MSDYYNIPDMDADEKSNVDQQTAKEAVPAQENQLPEGLENYQIVEIEQPESEQSRLLKEIEETARQEGLANQPVLGGENAKSEDVISELKKEFSETSQKAAEKRVEHEEKKVKRVIATSDMVLNRIKKLVEVPVRISTYNSQTDEVELEDWIFKLKRLTDKQSTSLINWDINEKSMKDMTPHEREISLGYKRRLLAAIVVEPYFTEDQWLNDVDTALVLELFQRAQHILMSTQDEDLYKDFQNKSRTV